MTGIYTPSWQWLLSTASSNGTPKTGCSSTDDDAKKAFNVYYIYVVTDITKNTETSLITLFLQIFGLKHRVCP